MDTKYLCKIRMRAYSKINNVATLIDVGNDWFWIFRNGYNSSKMAWSGENNPMFLSIIAPRSCDITIDDPVISLEKLMKHLKERFEKNNNKKI